MFNWNLKTNLGFAWISMSFAFALHVADEAFHDFLLVYNPAVTKMQESIPLLPIPTFTFETWLTGLILVIIILSILSPFAFRNVNWIRKVSHFYGIIMFINGVGHIMGSFALGYFMPGVLSSPLLLFTSTYLLWSVSEAKKLKVMST
jgi:hypothetical protein